MLRRSGHGRAGITLIEILVVLAIIGILMGIGGAAYQRFRVSGQVKATEDIVAKLQGGVDDQLKVIADNVRREKLLGSADFSGIQNYCGGDPDRAEAMLVYCRIKQNFPQSTADLTQTCTVAPLAGKPGFTLGGVNFPLSPVFTRIPTTGTADQTAAACLYTALSERVLNGKVFDSDAGTSGRQLDIPVGTGSIRVYRDSWDQPILLQRFYQTGGAGELDRPPYVKQGATLNDPFDPAGKLAQAGWTNKTAAEQALGFNTPGSLFNNQNKAILVYSYGKNKVLDGFAGDDILGYKTRSLGARGTNQP